MYMKLIKSDHTNQKWQQKVSNQAEVNGSNCLGRHQMLLSRAVAECWGRLWILLGAYWRALGLRRNIFSLCFAFSPHFMKNPLHFDLLKGMGLTRNWLHYWIFFAVHNVTLPQLYWPSKQTKDGVDFGCKCWNRSLLCHYQHISHFGQLSINVTKIEHL